MHSTSAYHHHISFTHSYFYLISIFLFLFFSVLGSWCYFYTNGWCWCSHNIFNACTHTHKTSPSNKKNIGKGKNVGDFSAHRIQFHVFFCKIFSLFTQHVRYGGHVLFIRHKQLRLLHFCTLFSTWDLW